MTVLCASTVGREVRDDAVHRAAQRYGCRPAEILTTVRSRPYVHARQWAMWRLRQIRRPSGEHRYSYPAIARAVGLKDHTTAMHAERAIEKRGEARL